MQLDPNNHLDSDSSDSDAATAVTTVASVDSAAVTRKPLHTRTVICEVFERSDGLIDIEGRLQDITPEDTQLLFKRVSAGNAIHDMLITFTINRELCILEARAYIRASPSGSCCEIESAYSKLEGLYIGAGFRQKAKSLVGGVQGCTHLNELLSTVITTAMQAHWALRRRTRGLVPAGSGPMPKPALIDTCHAYRRDSPASERIWPLNRRADNTDNNAKISDKL